MQTAQSMFDELKTTIQIFVSESELPVEHSQSELSVSESSTRRHGSDINPHTIMTIEYAAKNRTSRLRFIFTPASFRDKQNIGTCVGDYLAHITSKGEIEFFNPFFIHRKNYTASLNAELTKIFQILSNDFLDILNGNKIGIRGIRKKDWRSYQESYL